MKRSSLLLAAAVLLSAVLPAGASEPIFSGKDLVRAGWDVSGWGGVQVKTIDKGGKTPGAGFVTTLLDAKSLPYSGLSFHVTFGQDPLGNGVSLTNELLSSGMVELFLNCGKDTSGKPAGGAKVKFSLTFVTKDGKAVAVPLDDVTTLDSDPDSWEPVQLSFATFLAKIPDSSSIAGLSAVGIQYVEAPTCEVRVTDCVVKMK